VILWAVRWYLQFPVSYRDLEVMLADRGVVVDHTTMYRWVQRFAPELEKRMRRHPRPCRGPWYVDETYVRVSGHWRYLYRAVDGAGQTIDFRLGAKRDKAAKRFFKRALGREHTHNKGCQGRDRLGGHEIVRAQERDPGMDAARDFIIVKLGAERYSALADQPSMGYMRIARMLGKEALNKG
jgi:hypothetical protein